MKKWAFWLIVGIAFVCQMAVVVPSGSRYCNDGVCGTYFWGAHEHDGVWHLSIVNSALKNWSSRFPTYAGEGLSGYNILLDYLLKGANQLTSISAITWYFKIMPIIWFVVTVWIWQKFAKAYDKRYSYLLSLLFFVFWGNSFSYLLRYFHERSIWGASGLLAMQSPQMLNNIQFALTLPLVGALLIILMRKAQTWESGIKIGVIAFLIMGLKFYGGVVIAAMLGVYGLLLLIEKRYRELAMVGITSIIGALVAVLWFYNPLQSFHGSAILTWKPLATVHPIIEESGLVFLPWVANLRNNLAAAGDLKSWRLIIIEGFTIAIFIVLNWGTRIVAVFNKHYRNIDFVIGGGIVAGILMNVLFIQRGEWWNTVQFLYYAMFLSGIWAAKVLANYWESKVWGKIAVVIIVGLTIPNGIDTMRIFTSFPSHSYVSDQEQIALNKLAEMPEGVVLALPIEPVAGHENQSPRPLFNMYDTAYVSAFSGKQTYLNDLVQLRLVGIDYAERLSQVKTKNCHVLSQVAYIYISGDYSPMLGWQKCLGYELRLSYEGGDTRIYSVITDTPNQN